MKSWPDNDETKDMRDRLTMFLRDPNVSTIIDLLIQARIRQYDNRVADDIKKALEDERRY